MLWQAELLHTKFSAKNIYIHVTEHQRLRFAPRIPAFKIGGYIGGAELVFNFGNAQRDRAVRSQLPRAMAKAKRQHKIDAINLVIGHPDAAVFHHAMTTGFKPLPGSRGKCDLRIQRSLF
ncbi:hypothetical protein D3C75_735420 [compost metagenome]